MRELTSEEQVELVVTVNKYFTPFALLLVGCGIVLTQPFPWVAWTCVGMFAFSAFFNTITAGNVKKSGRVSPGLAAFRLYTNLAVNAVFVYLLAGYWKPIWLLFVLTPAATALYADRRKTIRIALMTSGLLIGAFAVRNANIPSSPIDWGEILVESAFIVFLALFLQALSQMVRRNGASAR